MQYMNQINLNHQDLVLIFSLYFFHLRIIFAFHLILGITKILMLYDTEDTSVYIFYVYYLESEDLLFNYYLECLLRI
jgi:hypothetical protein